MSRVILSPSPDALHKWGELAYVSDAERIRILSLPFGQFAPEIERLKKEIKKTLKSPHLAIKFFQETK